MLAQVMNLYLNLNVLIGVGFFCIGLLPAAMSKRVALKTNYLVLSFIPLFLAISPFLPKSTFFEPIAKVWSEQQKVPAMTASHEALNQAYLSLDGFHSSRFFEVSEVQIFISCFFGLAIFLGLLRISLDFIQIARIRRKSFVLKRIGEVTIFTNDQIQIPFSFWRPGQKSVVLPESFLSLQSELKLVLKHELQHHRQGDTKMVYLVWFLKSLCILNPFVYLWDKKISELQEFACDEALVDQHRVDSHAYARCLLKAVETLVHEERKPVCATGLSFLMGQNLLKRRIETMLNQKSKKRGWKFACAVVTLSIALFSLVSYAAEGWVQDRRITQAQAEEMLKNAPKSDFPIAVNEPVLKALNHYLGTVEGRKFLKESFARMKAHEAMITKKLDAASAPRELLAVPVVESGYQNLKPSGHVQHGAGLWMFIKATALTYGLKVTEQQDDRLDIDRETDAAIRLLKRNQSHFENNWLLSLLVYNAGDSAVNAAIEKTKSHDAWVISEAGVGDSEYLARVVAVALILKNPSALQ